MVSYTVSREPSLSSARTVYGKSIIFLYFQNLVYTCRTVNIQVKHTLQSKGHPKRFTLQKWPVQYELSNMNCNWRPPKSQIVMTLFSRLLHNENSSKSSEKGSMITLWKYFWNYFMEVENKVTHVELERECIVRLDCFPLSFLPSYY